MVTPRAARSADGFNDLLTHPMLLKQMAEGGDCGLIRDAIADQFDARQADHGRRLDQGLFHGRVAEPVPLLQQMNPQHCCQRIGSSAAFLARFEVARLDQLDECLSRHQSRHLREKLLARGELLDRG